MCVCDEIRFPDKMCYHFDLYRILSVQMTTDLDVFTVIFSPSVLAFSVYLHLCAFTIYAYFFVHLPISDDEPLPILINNNIQKMSAETTKSDHPNQIGVFFLPQKCFATLPLKLLAKVNEINWIRYLPVFRFRINRID